MTSCEYPSVPDRLTQRVEPWARGRNVCVLWLLGKCVHGATCYYAHDKTYLDEGGWWNNVDKVLRLSSGSELELTGNKRADRDLYLEALAAVQDWRTDEWMSDRFSSLDDETLRGPLGDVNFAATQRSVNPGASRRELRFHQ